MRWSKRRKQFRSLLEGKRCVHPGSVFDPISARIAEDLGFEAGMFAGSVASLTVLGAPDLIVLTLSELAAQAYRIGRASGLPLLVDADHGYGNALNVKRTVEELESAGVAALSIEDTVLPRSFGAIGGTSLISVDEGVGKMRAAISGREDPGLVIAGRTSATAVTSVGMPLPASRPMKPRVSMPSFWSVCKPVIRWIPCPGLLGLPIILGGAAPDLMDLDYLASRGVRICLQGHQPFQAAVRAVYDTLKALRDGVSPNGSSKIQHRRN